MCQGNTHSYEDQVEEVVDQIETTAAEEGLELLDILKALTARM